MWFCLVVSQFARGFSKKSIIRDENYLSFPFYHGFTPDILKSLKIKKSGVQNLSLYSYFTINDIKIHNSSHLAYLVLKFDKETWIYASHRRITNQNDESQFPLTESLFDVQATQNDSIFTYWKRYRKGKPFLN